MPSVRQLEAQYPFQYLCPCDLRYHRYCAVSIMHLTVRQTKSGFQGCPSQIYPWKESTHVQLRLCTTGGCVACDVITAHVLRRQRDTGCCYIAVIDHHQVCWCVLSDESSCTHCVVAHGPRHVARGCTFGWWSFHKGILFYWFSVDIVSLEYFVNLFMKGITQSYCAIAPPSRLFICNAFTFATCTHCTVVREPPLIYIRIPSSMI